MDIKPVYAVFLLIALLLTFSLGCGDTNLYGGAVRLCTDSDQGQNPNVLGTTYISNTNNYKTDYCQSAATVTEYYCSNNKIKSAAMACSSGLACSGGYCQQLSACVPSTEVCDGKDNDCDGQVDEGLGSTTCGVGVCQRTAQNCVNGVVQSCVPGTPGAEICNNLDDNCNGQVDDGLGSTSCGVGACQRTTQNCINGVTQTCVPGTPVTEICGNGIDDDCEGTIDEGCTTCIPSTEVCDGKDNDCDTLVDEELGSTTCGVGVCQRTTQNCVNGAVQSCAPGTPGAEVCNRLDDNCNSQIDDGLGSTTCGAGACQRTTQNCVNGVTQTCIPGNPVTEVCNNGIDDDCDGATDEGCSTTGNIYYVSTTGSDINTGTLAQPWRTIQKCLNSVKAGDTCLLSAGTYNEALTLKASGTASLPITLRCATAKGCTVNSGSSKTIITGGRVDYYTIDGLRLIANFTPVDQSDVSIDLGKNMPFSSTDRTFGNNGFIIRNCYIEGAIHFYGHNNLMENCELNGKNIWHNGLIDNFAASFNNIYRNNTIYNYIVRAVWSMNGTDNILIEGNTIHDVRHGIDCDGAFVPTTRCNLINNHIYNVGINGWGTGLFLENCFNCLIQGNTIHDIQQGPGIFFENYGNGSINEGWHTFNNIEYRNKNTNTRIIGNVIYNYHTDAGISLHSVNGVIVDHNTIYFTGVCSPSTAVCSAIGLTKDMDTNGVIYCSQNETITNNVLFEKGINWFCTPTVNDTILLGNFIGNPLFVNPPTDLHLQPSSPACTSGQGGGHVGAYPCQ